MQPVSPGEACIYALECKYNYLFYDDFTALGRAQSGPEHPHTLFGSSQCVVPTLERSGSVLEYFLIYWLFLHYFWMPVGPAKANLNLFPRPPEAVTAPGDLEPAGPQGPRP